MTKLINALYESGKIVALTFKEGIENANQYVGLINQKQARQLIKQGTRIATNLKPALDYESAMYEIN